jgi:hypothetical protein
LILDHFLMAGEERDREDLLREATALAVRVELAPVGSEDESRHIVVGFRRGGDASFFFGPDFVIQFNAAGELRRAYCDGLLYKAERGRLVSLERVRTPDAVQLVRQELTAESESKLISRMGEQLRNVATGLETNALRIVGQVPAETDVLGRVRSWLTTNCEFAVAKRANVSRSTRAASGELGGLIGER